MPCRAPRDRAFPAAASHVLSIHETGDRGSRGRGCVVNQLLRHNVPPLSDSPLKGTDLTVGEFPWMCLLQSYKEGLPGCVRFLLQP